MSDWEALLDRPDGAAEDWFTRIAERLLNGARLVAGGEEHRFVEVEFYYHGEGHPDPFTHRDPLQLECGRWYFHRTRGTYRSGSFKGLDLTFGDGEAFGGVLIRGLETAGEALIDGPSLCVDHLLDATGAANVAALDRAIAGRPAWEAGNPLLLRAARDGEVRPLVRSARVGLSLKRAGARTEATRYVMSPYRYLTEPRRTKKGKALIVLGLAAAGEGAEAIARQTGCPRQAVQRYLAEQEAGRRAADFAPYFGADLGLSELCRLHGVWAAHWGGPSSRGGTPRKK
jgi:hypothetical protein